MRRYLKSATAQALDHLFELGSGAIAPTQKTTLHGAVLSRLPSSGLRHFWRTEIQAVRVEGDRCILTASTATAARIVDIRREQIEAAVAGASGYPLPVDIEYERRQ